MRIIPVIDLKAGRVVRAVGGRRDEYRPIESQLTDESTPSAIAMAFRRLGFDTVYVADLDAIAGGFPDYRSYASISDAGLSLWLDAGIRDPNDADDLLRFDRHDKIFSGLIVGSETIGEDIFYFVESQLGKRMIFSLDLRGGELLTNVHLWQDMKPLELAKEIVGERMRRLIVLDLARVGESTGVGTETLCRELRAAYPSLELIAGGGVRGQADLHALAAAGCNAALVASALHDGRIVP